MKKESLRNTLIYYRVVFFKDRDRSPSLARAAREGGGDAEISLREELRPSLPGDGVIRLGSCVAPPRLFL